MAIKIVRTDRSQAQGLNVPHMLGAYPKISSPFDRPTACPTAQPTRQPETHARPRWTLASPQTGVSAAAFTDAATGASAAMMGSEK